MAFGATVQSGSVGTGTSGDASASCAAATAGNLLVAVVARSSASVPNGDWGTVSGWTLLASSPANSGNMCASIWGTIAAGGETSFATSMTDSAGNWTCQIHEFEGPFNPSFNDAAAGSENESFLSSTTVTISTGTGGTTSSASSLALAFFAVDQGLNFGTRSYTNSFTEVAAATSGARAAGVLAKRVLTTTGTYETTLSYSAGGGADEMYAALVVAKAVATGSRPTVALDTPDAHEFSSSTPTLQFTGTDTDADDIEFEIQIANNASFDAAGTNLTASHAGGSDATVHPNPHASATSPTSGNIQVDDRPGTTFLARGGILDAIVITARRDEADTDGTAYIRVHAITGTVGTDAQPAGANPADGGVNTPTAGWLAISDGMAFDATMSTSDTPYTFHFSGANRIVLAAGTRYMLIVDWVPVNRTMTNTIEILWDASVGNAGESAWIDGQSANYGYRSDMDGRFELYEVQTLVAADSTIDAGFANQDNGGDTHPFTSGDQHAYTVQSALDNGTYYWRVRASDSEGAGDWSETRSFVVDVPPGVSGALSLGATTLSGTAEVARSTAGALAVPASSLAATAVIARSASGALTAPSAALSASMGVIVIASGALEVPAVALAGSAGVARSTSGALTVPAATLVASADVSRTIAGALSVTVPTLAASVSVARAASGALAVPALALAATTTGTVTVAGAITMPAVGLAGVVSIARFASGDLAIAIPVVAGTVAGEELVASAALVSPVPVLDASVMVSRAAAGLLSVSAPVLDADGMRIVSVDGVLLLSPPDLAAASAISRLADGDLTAAALVLQAAAVVGDLHPLLITSTAVQSLVPLRTVTALTPARGMTTLTPSRTVDPV